MKKTIFILTILFVLISSNKAYEQHQTSIIDQNIVNDLILIRNTYNWVNDESIRWEMIRRQNMLVSIDDRYLYEDFLIHEKVEGN